jgi:hypothetical protein
MNKTNNPGNWSKNGYWQPVKVANSLPVAPQYQVPQRLLEQMERAAVYRNFKSLYD